MKIEAGSISPSEIQNDRSTRPSTASSLSTQLHSQNADRTTLSRDNPTAKSLVGQAMATPEVRQDKVAQLKQAVSDGTYRVDPQQLATAMLGSVE